MKKKITLFLLLTLSILSACSNNTNEVKDSPLYDGEKLTIGVVGKIPKVREQNIVFKNIELKDLSQKNLASKYNAVFITKEHLSEAANAPYAKIYKNSGIPFFFIESKKSFVPFINEDINYKEFPDSAGEYASGYYQSGDSGQSWGFGLFNDTVNEVNIEDVFSRIFKTIESVNNQK
ncbi:hypothetical protein V7152_17280 [Neobacillus drentensis]|uniref:hypothetical protein n=1 Tax=Neobacillus drentensis TaxID=220684 RepID=UPI002FFEDD56